MWNFHNSTINTTIYVYSRPAWNSFCFVVHIIILQEGDKTSCRCIVLLTFIHILKSLGSISSYRLSRCDITWFGARRAVEFSKTYGVCPRTYRRRTVGLKNISLVFELYTRSLCLWSAAAACTQAHTPLNIEIVIKQDAWCVTYTRLASFPRLPQWPTCGERTTNNHYSRCAPDCFKRTRSAGSICTVVLGVMQFNVVAQIPRDFRRNSAIHNSRVPPCNITPGDSLFGYEPARGWREMCIYMYEQYTGGIILYNTKIIYYYVPTIR